MEDAPTHHHSHSDPPSPPHLESKPTMLDVLVEGHSEIAASVALPPPLRVSSGAHISSMEQYSSMHKDSVENTTAFWAKHGREMLSWFRPFSDSAV